MQPANYLLIALKGNSCTENKKYTLISQQSLVNSTYHLLFDIFCILKDVFIFHKQDNAIYFHFCISLSSCFECILCSSYTSEPLAKSTTAQDFWDVNV